MLESEPTGIDIEDDTEILNELQEIHFFSQKNTIPPTTYLSSEEGFIERCKSKLKSYSDLHEWITFFLQFECKNFVSVCEKFFSIILKQLQEEKWTSIYESIEIEMLELLSLIELFFPPFIFIWQEEESSQICKNYNTENVLKSFT
jgi:hypothetical protein